MDNSSIIFSRVPSDLLNNGLKISMVEKFLTEYLSIFSIYSISSSLKYLVSLSSLKAILFYWVSVRSLEFFQSIICNCLILLLLLWFTCLLNLLKLGLFFHSWTLNLTAKSEASEYCYIFFFFESYLSKLNCFWFVLS